MSLHTLSSLSQKHFEQFIIVNNWISFELYMQTEVFLTQYHYKIIDLIYTIPQDHHLLQSLYKEVRSYQPTRSSAFEITMTLSAPGKGKLDQLLNEYIERIKIKECQIKPYINQKENSKGLVGQDLLSTVIQKEVSISDDITKSDDEYNTIVLEQQDTLPPVVGTNSQIQRYDTHNVLGEGGMSIVYRVFDQVMNRFIALKKIKPNLDDLAYTTFEIEARVTGKLEHPNILPIYDFVKFDQQFGYTMRIAQGQTLHQKIHSETGIGLHDLCSTLKQIANALEYAHQRGVIHRDVKPQNILLGNEGEIYLTDWGICALDPGHEDAALISTDLKYALVGTPSYMAPEQALCDYKRISPATDVYGLGATLYHGLLKKPPFQGQSLVDILREITQKRHSLYESLSQVKHIPDELKDICLKAISNQSYDRFMSAKSFANALDQFMKGQFEQERRKQLVKESTIRGHSESKRFYQLYKQRAQLESQIRNLQKDRHQLDQNKKLIWSYEERRDDLNSPIEEAFARATASYRNALIHAPYTSDVVESLSELFWTRFEEAESAKDVKRVAYFEELIREHADPKILSRLDQPSRIILKGLPDKTKVQVWSYKAQRYHTVQHLMYEFTTPTTKDIQLSRGSYLLKFIHHLAEPVLLHIYFNRASQYILNYRLPKKGTLPAGFVYIPFQKEPQSSITGLAFMSCPVRCAEYFEFLNQLTVAQASKHVPRYNKMAYITRDKNGEFSLPMKDLEGDEWQKDWPILLINWHDATTYAKWKSTQINRTLRLPYANEWVFAAQGADHRKYPWGNCFDHSLCHMRDSARGRTMPKNVGSTASDCSPYGLYDVAGNIAQWTNSLVSGSTDVYRVKGAGFNSMEILCDLNQEMESPVSFCGIHLGFRLVFELNESDYL